MESPPTFDCETVEACIARTGGAARMGNTKARRSIDAASHKSSSEHRRRKPNGTDRLAT
ncbi:MAG: hypothetical protein ACYSSL_06370 [Planctomycetota bacterium]